jgi:MYXO-CTERM domain-containing protein
MLPPMSLVRVSSFVAGACAVAAPVLGTAVAIDRASQGWYAETGAHFAGNSSTFTGKDTSTLFGTVPLGVYRFNSFFTFNLPNLGGPATAAALNLYATDMFNDNTSYEFTVFEVGTGAGALNAGHGNGESAGQAIYNDLGSGLSYAPLSVQRYYLHQRFHIVLNAAALSDITARSGGSFAVGISFTGPYQTQGGPEGVNFGFSSDPRVQLVVGTGGSDINSLLLDPVPPPSAAGLGAAGLCLVALRRARRQLQPHSVQAALLAP